jgi:hypothetical protein
MIKKIITIILFPSIFLGSQINISNPVQGKINHKKLEVTEKDLEGLVNQAESWKKQLKDGKNTLNLDELQGKDGYIYGKKMATYKVPERSEEIITDPEKRALTVDKNRIEEEYKSLKDSKKTINIPEFYKFLSTYGMLPKEHGNLPKEKELYKLMKDGKVKIKVEKKYSEPTETNVKYVKILNKN